MRLGRLRVSGGFLLLCAWLFYRDSAGIVWQGLLACLLHEAGHCLALWYFRKDVKEISFTIFGAQLLWDTPLSYAQEWITAAAGPGVNLLLAYLSCTFPQGKVFAGVNLALALFNLLPVARLDGARILRCTLAMVFSDEISYQISSGLSFAFTVCFALLGVFLAFFLGNLTLFFMCLWLLKGQLEEKTF